MNEQRVLLPFIDSVSVEAIDYALHFSKAAQLPLVALALILQPMTGNVRAEYIQQANDFLETIEARAEMHSLFIERHQCFSQDVSVSILDALMRLDCQGIIVPLQGNVPCFIDINDLKVIQEHPTVDMYLIHLPPKAKKNTFRSVPKVLSGFFHL